MSHMSGVVYHDENDDEVSISGLKVQKEVMAVTLTENMALNMENMTQKKEDMAPTEENVAREEVEVMVEGTLMTTQALKETADITHIALA